MYMGCQQILCSFLERIPHWQTSLFTITIEPTTNIENIDIENAEGQTGNKNIYIYMYIRVCMYLPYELITN